MKLYLDMLEHIMDHGVDRGDRTGTGTRSVFGYQMRFNLRDGFPLVTTKKTHLRSIIHELLWFLKGDTNVRYLQENGVSIWDEWADESGDLGPVYGYQWRSWPTGTEIQDDGREVETGLDQIADLIEQLKTNPESRRLIVSAWNPADVHHMALPPCHCLFQFYVAEGRLSCQLYQRSADSFLGVPFNIASYALLTHLIAHHVGLEVGDFVWTGGDVHVYHNHFVQTAELFNRDPRPLPELHLHHEPERPLHEVRFEDIDVIGYDPHPAIKAKVAV